MKKYIYVYIYMNLSLCLWLSGSLSLFNALTGEQMVTE